jgi:hypothetical protein
MAKRLGSIQESVRVVAEEIRKNGGRGTRLGPTDKINAVIGAGRGCTEKETAAINWIGLAMKRCWDRQSAGARIADWPIEKVAHAVLDMSVEIPDGRDEAANFVDRYALRCW